ncbi:HlyD family efflux transporter periplasmic adaptor subunit [Rhizobium sp. KDH_Rht_773_N]
MTRADAAAELRDVENKQAELVEKEVAAADQLKHIEIRAPIGGAVHQLSVHTVGVVVSAAETLMEIVPNRTALTVEARIAPRNIDQLMVGQPATLRLTAFSRNTTPQLVGSLARVSADLEIDQKTGAGYYRAAVTIPDAEVQKLRGLALVSGMPVETFIRTGDRTVLSYFIKPIRDHASRVFRED